MIEENNPFKKATVGLPLIIGSSTINHGARVNLAMNCSEYCFMDYIYRCVKKNRIINITETFRQTGFTQEQQETLLHHLIAKGFILPIDDEIPRLTTKWESAFADLDREFEELFWKKDDKVVWTGSSKKRANSFYYNLRKKYSREFLIDQRNEYLRYLEAERKTGFPRRIMAAERWLNPINEYYDVDWKLLANEREAEFNKNKEKAESSTKKENLTLEQRKQQYEQDSNQ